MKPGYKTTEFWLSALAGLLSVLVALKWVPITVSKTVQADAVLALPVISAGYALARGIAKHGKVTLTDLTPFESVLQTAEPLVAKLDPAIETDIAEVLAQMKALGMRGAEALKTVGAAAEGAKVGQADLTKVSDALTTAMTDYPLTAPVTSWPATPAVATSTDVSAPPAPPAAPDITDEAVALIRDVQP